MLAPIVWEELLDLKDAFYDFVKSLPSERYKETDPRDGETLLHYTVRVDSVKSAVHLILGGIDIHVLSQRGTSPLLLALYLSDDHNFIKLFIAAGLYCIESFNYCCANSAAKYTLACIFISNGYRVLPKYDTPELCKFQNGVLRCRSATIAMIRLKHYYKSVDRFLFREMAFSIWVTRSDDEWYT